MGFLNKKVLNKNIIAGTSYLIGNFFNKAIAFITIPIFTRLMSTTDYGIVNTYLSWVSILSLIVGLSLGSSIRSASQDFSDNLDEYISSIFFLSLINFILVFSSTVIAVYFFNKQIDINLVILCLIQSYMTFILNCIDIKYMMTMNYIKKTLLLSIPNIIIAIISVICLLNIKDNKYLGRIIPYVLVLSCFGTYYLIRHLYKGRKYIQLQYWRYAIKLSLPLIFHGLSLNILSNSDRTMITLFRNSSEAGIYSLAYNFSMLASVITSSLESVWIPWFNNKMNENCKSDINQAAKIYIEIVLILMICILMVSPEVLVIMAPKEYWIGKLLIPPILLASFFMFLYSISVNLEYYYRSTKIIAFNTFVASLVNLVLNFIFIPKYGSVAAAYTTVVAYIISFSIHYYVARMLDNELFPLILYMKPIIILVISVFIEYFVIDFPIIRWGITIIVFITYCFIIYKRKKLSSLL